MVISQFKLTIKNAISYLLSYLFIGVIIYGILKVSIPTPKNIFLESVTLITKDIICQGLVLWLILLHIKSKRDPGFEFNFIGTINYKLLSILLIITIGYFFWYQNSIGLWAEKIPVSKQFSEYINAIWLDYKRNPIPLLSSVILFAPVFEELFFRGILLKGLLASYKPYTAILLSAVLFGLFHFNGPQSLNAFFIGLFLGIIYFRTQSLLLCIAVHAFNNSMATMIDLEEFSYRYTAFFSGLLLFCIGILFLKHLGYFSSNKLSSYVDPEIAKMKDIDP